MEAQPFELSDLSEIPEGSEMPEPLEPPEVIFFDAMGTLFDLKSSVGETYAAVAARFGVSVSGPALDRAFAAAFRVAPPMAFPGVSPEALAQCESDWWLALAQQTFAQAGVIDQFDSFPAFFRELYRHFSTPEPWRVYPDTVPTLEQWRSRGVPLGVISNFDSRLHGILKELGLRDYFSSVTISTEAGAAKPDAAIFAVALAKHGIQPALAWHIGDSRSADYVGARAAGIQGFWLRR